MFTGVYLSTGKVPAPGGGGCLLMGVPVPRGVPAHGGLPAPRGGAWYRWVPGLGVPDLGACSGPVPWGCLLQGVPGGDPPSRMATAAGGTRPTGMHSCVLAIHLCFQGDMQPFSITIFIMAVNEVRCSKKG